MPWCFLSGRPCSCGRGRGRGYALVWAWLPSTGLGDLGVQTSYIRSSYLLTY